MLWECMVIALKATIGGFLWLCVGVLCVGSIGLVSYWYIRRKENESCDIQDECKPKYKGQPIVIQGEKEKHE